MRKTGVKLILTAAMITTFAVGMAFAKTSSVTLMYAGKIGNHLTLKPGNYKVMVNSAKTPEVAFYKGGKLVGQATVKLVAEQKKMDQTAIYYSSPHDNMRKITEIDINGWSQKIMFPASKSSMKSD